MKTFIVETLSDAFYAFAALIIALLVITFVGMYHPLSISETIQYNAASDGQRFVIVLVNGVQVLRDFVLNLFN